jgi:hypothetical protein
LLLRGLGGDWITNGPSPNRGRYEALVEVEGASNAGPCRVLDFQSDKAGTATLSLEMSSAYRREDGQPIEARRLVAVDYTGRSGAELLMVILDRVRGPGKKAWTLPTGAGAVDHGDKTYHAERLATNVAHAWKWVVESQPRQDAEGKPRNEFVLRGARGGASARGVILRPAGCEITLVPTITKGTLPVLRISSDAGTAEFLAVLTLQKGAPPPVSCEGEAPNATIKAGKQKVLIAEGGISFEK